MFELYHRCSTFVKSLCKNWYNYQVFIWRGQGASFGLDLPYHKVCGVRASGRSARLGGPAWPLHVPQGVASSPRRLHRVPGDVEAPL